MLLRYLGLKSLYLALVKFTIMKKIYYAFMAVSLAIGCSTPEMQSVDAIVSGEITNPKNNLVRIYGGGLDVTDSLNSDNKFVVKLDSVETGYFTFRHGNEIATVYLRPGDSLNLSLDTKKFDETIAFGGSAEAQNNYLAARVLQDDEQMSSPELYKVEEERFLEIIDSVNQAKEKLFETHSVNIEDNEFLSTEKTKLKLQVYNHKFTYKGYHKYLTGDTTFDVSSNFYDFISDVDVNNPSLLKVREYKSYLNNFISHKVDELSESDSTIDLSDVEGYAKANVKAIEVSIENTEVKTTLLGDMLSSYLSYLSTEYAESLISKINEWDTKQEFAPAINEKWERLKLVAPGVMSPDFNYVTNTGDSVSLSDYRGKLVYIDVWATWCGPCLRELPHLEEMQEEMKDMDVVFMSISIDDTPEPWAKMVEEKEMKGVQVYAQGAWNSSFAKDYVIQAIPRFILIDKEGKIITSNAPRPSGDAGTLIKENLDQNT